MEYDVALLKAWSELENVAKDKNFSVRFLSDKYEIDLKKKRVLSLSDNIKVQNYISILILHFLLQKLKGLPLLKEEWISFKQLEGGLAYYSAFKKRAIEPIVRKYGADPGALFESTKRFGARKTRLADASIIIEVFDGVPVLITLWKGDREFGPEANILFDKSIEDIFCTEDVAVLAGIIASVI